MNTAASLPVVWVVDDSPLEAEMSRRALASSFTVVAFGDGASVLERLAVGQRPDALVVDWQMPVMSGLELCQFIRKSHDVVALPVVILTATRHREDVLAALAAGANDYVMKPFDAEELSARVATAVQTKRLNALLKNAADFRERFVGIVGHDLRQPLNTLTIGTSVLLGQELPEKSMRTVRRLHAATERMSRMIADLLDLTRTRLGGTIPVDRQPMDFGAACREVVEELQLANPERAIELRVTGDDHGVWDRDRVQQVCTNLVGNALQHGAVTAPIRVTVGGDARDVTLTVQNSGVPIPADARASLFDPYRNGVLRTSASQGLGLGLFIVREIVLGHGGSITFESDETKTVFTVSLPREARLTPDEGVGVARSVARESPQPR